MALNEHGALLNRIQDRWQTLIVAEQQGASIQELEELYADYDHLLDAYKRCCGSGSGASVSKKSGGRSRASTGTPKGRKARKSWKIAS